MDEPHDNDWDHPDGEEAATSQSVASLIEIARELRELADYVTELSAKPLYEPTRH